MASSDASSERDTPKNDKTVVDLYSELPDAIERGSLGAVEKLLQYDGAVNLRFRYHFSKREDPSAGVTPLMLAAGLGQDDISQLLLENGADIDDMSRDNGSTAIHFAAEHAHVGAVDLLLKNGASVNDLNDLNYTPIIYACFSGSLEIVKLLLKCGADPTHIDRYGWNPLGWACRYGYSDIVRFLLGLENAVGQVGSSNRKDFLNIQDAENWTAINRAICNDHYDCAAVLLSEPDIDVTVIDDDGDTPLSTAARGNRVVIMVQILGTKTYFPDNPVTCSAHLASPLEFPRIEKALLNGIEQAMRKPQEQDRAMFWAVANGSLQVVQKCLERQPDLIRWSRAGATWLHIAAKYGRHELIRLFFARGLSSCVAADRNTTPLHLAAEGGHRIAVKYILENLQGITNSPSYQSRGSVCPGLELIQFIMQENDDGESPITLSGKAKGRGASDILWGETETFALSTPNFVDFLPIKPDRLAELAAQFERPGDERILKLLLKQEKRGDPNRSSQNWTALHWAVDSSHPVLVWWLLSNGAHLKSEEIQSALKIVKDKISSGHEISEVDLIITDLLENPPIVSAHAVNEDDYHLPELPKLPENHLGLDHKGIIVDFYCHDESTDFQYRKRNLRELIYEQGPNEIMTSVGRYNSNDLYGLRQQLGLAKRVPKLDSGFIPRSTTSETIATSKSERPKPPIGRESAKDASPVKAAEANEVRKNITDSQEECDFRWIHVPAHSVWKARPLIVHIMLTLPPVESSRGRWRKILFYGIHID